MVLASGVTCRHAQPVAEFDTTVTTIQARIMHPVLLVMAMLMLAGGRWAHPRRRRASSSAARDYACGRGARRSRHRSRGDPRWSVFAGQPVAVVVASTVEAARDGAELVEIDLEPLPAVVDVAAATAPDSPLARLAPDVEDASTEDGARGNVVGRRRASRGDVAAAFGRSAAIVEGRFRSSWAYQGYLEPHVATAWLEPDGTLVVSSSTQSTFVTRGTSWPGSTGWRRRGCA